MSHRMQISRRSFLKGAAGATAAAFALPYFVPGSALGADGRPAPSNRLTTAHIGIGNQGPGHFNAMLGNPGVQILAVCDVKKWIRDKYQAATAAKYGTGVPTYVDFRAVMARPEIDAVVIATPDHWHATIACAAAKAGKDIYCEKPMTLTIREARTLVNTVRRYERVFQTGSQQRSDWNFRYAAELVRNGKIGQLKTVYVGVGGPSSEKLFPEEPVPEGLDWDMWLGPAPWNPYNSERCSGNYGGGWRQVRDTSGGMMTDWGAHHFDIAQWGMGMDDSGPIEISPPEAKEYPSLTYKYASGVLMHHWFGNDTRQYQMPAGKGGGPNGILFVGTEGWVEVNRGYLNSNPASLTRTADGQQKEMLQFKPDEVHLHASKGGHHGDWFNSMRDRSRPVADVEIGCRTITVCHLGNIAYWTRRKLKWDPATEEIIGDPDAARWLDRPKRAPWTLL